MSIARIDVYQADLPYAGGTYHLSGGRSFREFDATFVRVIDEDGVQGWGESTPFGATYISAHAAGVRAGIEEMAPALIGADPMAHGILQDRMDAALKGHPHAKCALDIACWDLHGKRLGLPVWQLLGGRRTERIPLISSIGSGPPEDMRAQVAAHRAKGFRGHSIKIGAAEADGGPALDAARISACLVDREPGEWFLADANGGLSPEQVRRLARLLPADADIVLEAPCATWTETLAARRGWPGALLLDELIQSDADLIQAIRHDACDGVGLKLSKQGGLTAMARQAVIAEAAGLVISVQDSVGSELSFAAILHMAHTIPERLLRCALDTRAMTTARIAAFDAPIVDGTTAAPEAPGLGVTIDLTALGPPVAVYGV